MRRCAADLRDEEVHDQLVHVLLGDVQSVQPAFPLLQGDLLLAPAPAHDVDSDAHDLGGLRSEY